MMFLNMHEGMISQPVLIGTATVLESILCSPGGREGSRDLDIQELGSGGVLQVPNCIF